MSVGESSSGAETMTPTKLKGSSFNYNDGGSTAALLQKIQSVQEEQSNSQGGEDEQQEKLRQFKEVETKECKYYLASV